MNVCSYLLPKIPFPSLTFYEEKIRLNIQQVKIAKIALITLIAFAALHLLSKFYHSSYHLLSIDSYSSDTNSIKNDNTPNLIDFCELAPYLAPRAYSSDEEGISDLEQEINSIKSDSQEEEYENGYLS